MKKTAYNESSKFFLGPHNKGVLGFILLYPAESIKKDGCSQITKEESQTINPCDITIPYRPRAQS